MSVRRLDPNQPKDFRFTPENLAWAREQIKKYPEGREQAAVLPILWRAQEQNDYWLPEPAIRYVADLLGMPYIRVYEIATFYTMFNLSPVGRYHVQLCGTTPCMLRGADELKAVCEEVIGPQGKVTPEGVFSWIEVECLGACVNAPMAQINKDYYEDLTPENFRKLLDDLRRGRTVKTGPQTSRQFSAPASGPRTLAGPALTGADGTVWAAGKARGEEARQDAAQVLLERTSPVRVPESKGGPAEARPAWALDKPEGGAADDLKRIAGISPDIERLLNDMGVYHVRQIAQWTDKDVEWVGGRLRFDGSAGVRDWVVRAKSFASGRAGEGFAGADIAAPVDGEKT